MGAQVIDILNFAPVSKIIFIKKIKFFSIGNFNFAIYLFIFSTSGFCQSAGFNKTHQKD